MPVTFPGDNPFSAPSRQFVGAQTIGGVEKYGAVNGNSVSVTNLNASAITAGTIDASVLSVTNLNANNITSGNLSAARMQTNVISAVQAVATSLSAIRADAGTLTAGQLNGLTLNIGGVKGGNANFFGSTGANFYDNGNSLGGIIYAPGGGNLGIASNTANIVLAPSSKVLMGNNLDMNDKNIDACTTIYAFNFINRCEVAEGIDPFEVLASFSPESSEKSKKKQWKSLDHSKLHKSIYSSKKRMKTDILVVKDQITKKDTPMIVGEKEETIEGFNLGRLVELQRQAILELKLEIEKLKKA